MFLNAQDYEKINQVIAHYSQKLDLTVDIPREEYFERHRKVGEQLKARGADMGFFFWYREMPGDGVYLTGYNPTLEIAAGIIAPGKAPLLLVGPESGKWAQEAGLDLEACFTEEFSLPNEYYEGVVCVSLPEVIHRYAGENLKKVALLTSTDVLPCGTLDILRKAVGKDVEIVEALDILEELRYEKSPAEMRCMEQADIIAEAGVRAMLAVLRPGLRELQVSAVNDYVTKALGGESYGAESMATSGCRNRYIIAPASNKVIQEGEIVQLSSVPSYHCYKGVCRRTVVAGKRSELQQEFFEKLNRGYEIAVEALKEVIEKDLSNSHVDLAPRNYFATQTIDGMNMKAMHFYSTAHGTGLTECLEKQVVHPLVDVHYGNNVGMMLDLGLYCHPNEEICGGCVESAFFKQGNKMLSFTALPTDVQDLVGKGIE